MATKAKLVGQQELLQLCCVMCGVSIADNHLHSALMAINGSVSPFQPKGGCNGLCVYPVSLETLRPSS